MLLTEDWWTKLTLAIVKNNMGVFSDLATVGEMGQMKLCKGTHAIAIDLV